jgi:N-acetylneuraminate synthase
VGRSITIGTRVVGAGEPAFVIGEIGLNHNGDIEVAKRLIDVAAECGCEAVKFQKRTPELCVPLDQRDILRETPWGVMTYMDYRYRVEFEAEQYTEIAAHCAARGIAWTASPWDVPSVEFLAQFDVPFHKIPSAALTDDAILAACRDTGKPVILSTGMSTMDEIEHAIGVLGIDSLAVLHCTSTYPAKPEELNLRMIQTLSQQFDCPIGYSGHEVGLQTTVAAVALGACIIERHITLDRAMWGSDQAASVEPGGLKRLVRDIRVVEAALGDGVKRVYESEVPIRTKLRRNA